MPNLISRHISIETLRNAVAPLVTNLCSDAEVGVMFLGISIVYFWIKILKTGFINYDVRFTDA